LGRKKLWRLEELEGFDNLIQFTDQPEQDDFRLRGIWAKDHFKNSNPITLELACGKGDYTIALAEKHPDRNFIGIDMKGHACGQDVLPLMSVALLTWLSSA